MSRDLAEIHQPASMDFGRALSDRKLLMDTCEPSVIRHTPVHATGAASLFGERLLRCTGTSEPTMADLINQIIALDPHRPAQALNAFTTEELKARLAHLRALKAGIVH